MAKKAYTLSFKKIHLFDVIISLLFIAWVEKFDNTKQHKVNWTSADKTTISSTETKTEPRF